MPSAREIQRTTRLAGLLYLAAAILAMIGYLYLRPRFFIPGNPAATARSIVANEQLYRAGIAIEVVGQLIFIVVVLTLYRLFENVDRTQARLMAALIGTSIVAQFAGFALNVAPLMLLSDGQLFTAFTRAEVEALAYASLELGGKLVELLTSIWGLWLFPFAVLIFKSGFLPKFLGVLLIVSGVAYVLSFLVTVLFPGGLETFNQFVFPLYFAELIVIFWLALVGARPRMAET